MPKGFLLTLEELGAIYDYSCLDKYRLKVILEKRTNDKTIVLLRKIQDFKTNQQIVHVNNYEFSWINKIKSFMNVENDKINTRIIIVAEGDFECGLLGLVNCLRIEPGGEMIRSVFIQDGYAPAFSLQESLYMRQLQLDLPINVIRSGIWGSYRHFPLPILEPKFVESAYISRMVRGDLSTLCWIQSRIFFNDNEENLVRVVYASINFKDVMIASGRLTIESTDRNNNSLIGMEFAGFTKTGQRVMGLCSAG
ncbi:Fatty acid synthase [Camponotus floridanus]|uniref:Fatty acid synthase n=1 Tax=Camponotus floridanus TaxID=104421 RepID=E2AR93_CAMFO|nr:Fatty acid synthase [Camponotus floridanus]